MPIASANAHDHRLQRRSARALKMLLLCLLVLHILEFVLAGPPARWSVGEAPWPMLLMRVAVLAGSLLVLQRRGQRAAALLFVGGSLLLDSGTYLQSGLAYANRGALLALLPVLVAGVVLGRRALWLATAWLACAAAMGGWRDLATVYFSDDRVSSVSQAVLVTIGGLLLVALVLDQTLALLGEALRSALRHGDALARKRDALQLEMQEKERSREQLAHAMKMENVGRLASGVAHDFNHILAVIMGYASKGRRCDDPAELQQALQGVEAAARRANAVTRRLLDFSRQEPARPEQLDAAASIAGIEPLLRQLFPPGVQIRVDTGGVRCHILFDPALLELVVISMAANASHAMPDGGHFLLQLAWQGRGHPLQLHLVDDGHGMTEAVRQRCLEPFFTTKPSGQGTGLGLAVVASLVGTAGGTLAVESAPGQGTRFLIELPATAA